ncbi:MAG: LysR substrate-binding domain-containing protein, partial [Elsteraceae bacterium]
NIALQAALDGQGVAIGRRLLIREHLRAGRLAPVVDLVASAPNAGHWLISARHRRFSSAMTRFVDWLSAEITEASAA